MVSLFQADLVGKAFSIVNVKTVGLLNLYQTGPHNMDIYHAILDKSNIIHTMIIIHTVAKIVEEQKTPNPSVGESVGRVLSNHVMYIPHEVMIFIKKIFIIY